MPSTPFGVLLKSLREQRGLTQKDLGAKTGITYVAIGDWERGKRNPKRANVDAIAAALEVDSGPLLAAAGFLPVGADDKEIVYVSDPDTREIIEAYEGLMDERHRDIVLDLTRKLREAERERSVGNNKDRAVDYDSGVDD